MVSRVRRIARVRRLGGGFCFRAVVRCGAVLCRDAVLVPGLLIGAATPFRAVGILALEHGVFFQLFLHEVGKFQIGKLQQLDRLLQLRRHDEILTLPKVKPWCECHLLVPEVQLERFS